MTEKKVAKDIGARLVKNSGRGMRKSDMIREKHVIDLKEVGKSFQLNESVWKKVCHDSATYGYEYKPILLLHFANGMKLVVEDYNDWNDDIGRED